MTDPADADHELCRLVTELPDRLSVMVGVGALSAEEATDLLRRARQRLTDGDGVTDGDASGTDDGPASAR